MTEPLRALDALAALPEMFEDVLRQLAECQERIAELEAQRRAPLEGWYTVEQIVAQGRVKEGTLRDWLADREINGLSEHVKKQGRSLMIHGAGFEAWWLARGGGRR